VDYAAIAPHITPGLRSELTSLGILPQDLHDLTEGLAP
jgi:hypothetical protein